MKINFITREGYSLPGARIRCYNFARAVSRDDITACVLSFSDTLGAKDGASESQMGTWQKIRYNIAAYKTLARDKNSIFYIQRFNYHAFGPYLAHILKKNKMVFDLDDWEMRENPRYYLGFYPSSKAHYLTGLLARRSVLCIAASRYLESFLLQFNKRVCYIPSGVDTDLFHPAAGNPQREKVVFSWIGTFHRKEYVDNISFALDCFKVLRERYRDIFFEITGEGIYKKDIIKLVSECNDAQVILKDWICPDDMPAYLANIDIGLFPVVNACKFNMAKSPTKLFEYMAMAKPTVSSAIGETGSIVTDGENGLLARTKDDFISQMELLLKNASLRNRMGIFARKTVQQSYSLAVLGNKLSAALRQCA